MSTAFEAPASPRERVMALLKAYQDAPDDADIEVRIGDDAGGAAAVAIDINGTRFGLLASEAVRLADICEKSLRFGKSGEAEATGLPNLILALREGAKQAKLHMRRDQ